MRYTLTELIQMAERPDNRDWKVVRKPKFSDWTYEETKRGSFKLCYCFVTITTSILMMLVGVKLG